MATITLRATNGGPLTNAQVDANFTNLNTEKIERDGSIPMTGKLTLDTPVAANASVNFPSSATNPTSPVAGDVWNNSNALKFYDGSVAQTLATLAGSQSFTNKTINLASNTLIGTSAQLATAITDETGSGALVFATSPTLTTPTIAQVNASADFTLDAVGDVIIDADGGDVLLKDDGTTFGVLNNNSGNLVIKSNTTNAIEFTSANSLFKGEVRAPYFSTASSESGYFAFTEDIPIASTNMFGSWGNEPNEANIEYRGGISHNIGLDCSGPGTAEFKTISDGTNNGGAMMLMGIGGTIEFYSVPSAGAGSSGTKHTITGANMWGTHKKLDIGTNTVKIYTSLGVGINASGTTGRIDAAGDVVAFSTSDSRLKNDVVNIPDALNKVLAMNGVTYTWKPEFQSLHGFSGADIGVIAQEVEAVLPLAVRERWDGYKAVRYDKVIAVLIEAIKELNAKIEALGG